jgi:nitroreductase
VSAPAETTAELAHPKPAPTERSIHPLLVERYSPHAFTDEPVPEAVLERLLAAARWAPSSFNEQPWRFVVAHRERDPDTHAAIVDVLAEGNQAWASEAPVLVLTVTKQTFSFNGEPNAHARHDVGLAAAQLTVQATAEGIGVHQMAGFDAEAARQRFGIPESFEPVTAIALGYPAGPDELGDELAERASGPRERRPLDEIVHRSADEPVSFGED